MLIPNRENEAVCVIRGWGRVCGCHPVPPRPTWGAALNRTHAPKLSYRGRASRGRDSRSHLSNRPGVLGGNRLAPAEGAMISAQRIFPSHGASTFCDMSLGLTSWERQALRRARVGCCGTRASR